MFKKLSEGLLGQKQALFEFRNIKEFMGICNAKLLLQ
jgi:hypothetical protein